MHKKRKFSSPDKQKSCPKRRKSMISVRSPQSPKGSPHTCLINRGLHLSTPFPLSRSGHHFSYEQLPHTICIGNVFPNYLPHPDTASLISPLGQSWQKSDRGHTSRSAPPDWFLTDDFLSTPYLVVLSTILILMVSTRLPILSKTSATASESALSISPRASA